MKQLAAIAALLFVLPACRKHETVTANGSTVEIDRSGKNVTIRTVDGTATAGPAKLPEGFPKDVPVYPGARATATLVESGAPAAGRVATFETSDWPDDVAKFYARKLSGWTTAMDMKTVDGHTLLLKSPDGKRTLTLAATREALNTIFTLTVSGS